MKCAGPWSACLAVVIPGGGKGVGGDDPQGGKCARDGRSCTKTCLQALTLHCGAWERLMTGTRCSRRWCRGGYEVLVEALTSAHVRLGTGTDKFRTVSLSLSKLFERPSRLQSVHNVSVGVSAEHFWRGGRTSRAVVPSVEFVNVARKATSSAACSRGAHLVAMFEVCAPGTYIFS